MGKLSNRASSRCRRWLDATLLGIFADRVFAVECPDLGDRLAWLVADPLARG